MTVRTAFDDDDREQPPLPNGSDKPHRFKPVRFGDIRLSTSRPYLIRGLLPREGLGVVWGPPKCGKSFWVYDAAMHVALGWDYRGRRVQQGTVVYIACEGERGLGARTEAFRQARLTEGADPPFWLLPTRLDLVADADELILDITAAIGSDRCALIVVDTLNRTISGSESRDDDMGNYVKAADKLQRAFGGLVLLVHHCGINADRPRGHTSLSGACDVQIAVKRDDAADRILAEVELMKDGPEGDILISRFIQIEVGIDEDGEPITSRVVEPADGEPLRRSAGKKPKRLTASAKVALDTLRKAIAEAGQEAPASNHIPAAVQVVPSDVWRRFYYAGTASDGRSPEARKKAFQRVRDQLQAQTAIGMHTDLCWVAANA